MAVDLRSSKWSAWKSADESQLGSIEKPDQDELLDSDEQHKIDKLDSLFIHRRPSTLAGKSPSITISRRSLELHGVVNGIQIFQMNGHCESGGINRLGNGNERVQLRKASNYLWRKRSTGPLWHFCQRSWISGSYAAGISMI